MSYAWKCPFCGRDTTITDSDHTGFTDTLYIENSVGRHMIKGLFIVCPNEECKKYTLDVWLGTTTQNKHGNEVFGEAFKHWALVPPSGAQSFPEYVPKPIVTDYEEACLIVEGSAKASATLSRRCLQGIIRDFWKVKRPEEHKGKWTLWHEIEAIKDKVDILTWKAIDAVRRIGNIGAHMEENINLIIDVKPEEAEKLIELIELLIKDWYITRHEREVRLQEITAIADEKDEEKNGKKEKQEETPKE